MIIKTSKDEFSNYVSDAANFRGDCDLLVIPENKSELIDFIKKSNNEKKPVTIRGGGTGLTGAGVPSRGTVVSTEKLIKIIDIDENEKTVTLEPGVVLNDLQDVLKKRGFFYPPDPTETSCFIGGTIVNNSSGAKSFKYGPTRNFVEELEVILPTGEVLNLKRGSVFAENYQVRFFTDNGREIRLDLPKYNMPNTKNAAGYYTKPDMDLIDLFIGSEGTLGIVSQAKLKINRLPSNLLSAVIFFPLEEDALNFVDSARDLSRKRDSIINALGIEFFNSDALNFLRTDFQNIPASSCAVWIEQEIEEDEERILDAWLGIIEKHNGDLNTSWIATDPKDRMRFVDFRHSISYKISEYVAFKNIMKVGTDTAVPVSKFRDYYYRSKKLVEESNIKFVIYGHFGDCHMHLNMLPENEGEFNKARKIYSGLCLNAVKSGGTVSAEHGIGKLKREYLLMMYGEEGIREMAKVKKILDPNLILNIGNIIDEKYLKD